MSKLCVAYDDVPVEVLAGAEHCKPLGCDAMFLVFDCLSVIGEVMRAEDGSLAIEFDCGEDELQRSEVCSWCKHNSLAYEITEA